jgi:hypothetical protein
MRCSLNNFFTVWLVSQTLMPLAAPFVPRDIADFIFRAPRSILRVQPTDVPQADRAEVYAPSVAATVGRSNFVVDQEFDDSDSVTPIQSVIVVRDLLLIFGVDQEPQVQQTVLRLEHL